MVSAIKAHRKRQLEERLAAGGAWEDSGLIFTTPMGAAMDPRSATREYHALLESAELPSIRFTTQAHGCDAAVGPRRRPTDHHGDAWPLADQPHLNTYSHVLPALQKRMRRPD